MRTLVILFILLCFNFNNCIAQKRKNYSLLGISIGMHYTKVFNPERAVYHPEYCSINVDCTSNVSFKAQSRSGYQFGVNYKYISTRNFFMNAGLAYYRRHFNSEGIKDSVIKYSMSTSPYYIADHYSRTIEGVLAAGYTFHKIAVKLGYNFKLMERSVLKKTYLDESTDKHEARYHSYFN
ncbi:MAG: hypothetical protein ABI772_15735, partial [Bacteroidota bacterium]